MIVFLVIESDSGRGGEVGFRARTGVYAVPLPVGRVEPCEVFSGRRSHDRALYAFAQHPAAAVGEVDHADVLTGFEREHIVELISVGIERQGERSVGSVHEINPVVDIGRKHLEAPVAVQVYHRGKDEAHGMRLVHRREHLRVPVPDVEAGGLERHQGRILGRKILPEVQYEPRRGVGEAGIGVGRHDPALRDGIAAGNDQGVDLDGHDRGAAARRLFQGLLLGKVQRARRSAVGLLLLLSGEERQTIAVCAEHKAGIRLAAQRERIDTAKRIVIQQHGAHRKRILVILFGNHRQLVARAGHLERGDPPDSIHSPASGIDYEQVPAGQRVRRRTAQREQIRRGSIARGNGRHVGNLHQLEGLQIDIGEGVLGHLVLFLLVYLRLPGAVVRSRDRAVGYTGIEGYADPRGPVYVQFLSGAQVLQIQPGISLLGRDRIGHDFPVRGELHEPYAFPRIVDAVVEGLFLRRESGGKQEHGRRNQRQGKEGSSHKAINLIANIRFYSCAAKRCLASSSYFVPGRP